MPWLCYNDKCKEIQSRRCEWRWCCVGVWSVDGGESVLELLKGHLLAPLKDLDHKCIHHPLVPRITILGVLQAHVPALTIPFSTSAASPHLHTKHGYPAVWREPHMWIILITIRVVYWCFNNTVIVDLHNYFIIWIATIQYAYCNVLCAEWFRNCFTSLVFSLTLSSII